MTFRIIAAGKTSHQYAKTGIAEYVKRLKRYGKFELIHVKESDSESVSKRLLEAAKGSIIIAMDERGEELTSTAFAKKMQGWTDDPTIKSVSFLIGASNGHTEELRKQSRLLLRLSKMTMMHELALLVLLEQIYRGQTILKGEPYHR